MSTACICGKPFWAPSDWVPDHVDGGPPNLCSTRRTPRAFSPGGRGAGVNPGNSMNFNVGDKDDDATVGNEITECYDSDWTAKKDKDAKDT